MSNLINSKADRDRITAEKQIKILSFLLDERFSSSAVLALLLNMTPNEVQSLVSNDFERITKDFGYLKRQLIQNHTHLFGGVYRVISFTNNLYNSSQ